MNMQTTILLEARVDPGEKSGLVVAARLLASCLGRAAGIRSWPVRIRFCPIGSAVVTSPGPSAIITSLAPEMQRADEPIADTESRWRASLNMLQTSRAPVFVRTIFRHISGYTRAGLVPPELERILRLNRMAITLSHDLGIGVIDIDRIFAHIGGRTLETDHRLAGGLAAGISGYATAWGLLSAGLDEIPDSDLQERARMFLGDLDQIGSRIEQRHTSVVSGEP